MASDPLDDPLRQSAWRARLSPSEQQHLRAWLAAHPQAQDSWELETALTEALAALRNHPVPSNFTARVLKTVESDPAGPHLRGGLIWGWVWRWAPRAAWAGLMLLSARFSHQYFQHTRRLDQMAQSVVVVSELGSVPNPNILADFDAIHAMDRTPADLALLDLMQ